MTMQFETIRSTTRDLVTRTTNLNSTELEERLAPNLHEADRQTADSSRPFVPLARRSNLPSGWSRTSVQRWCDELDQALERFGTHALDAIDLQDAPRFQDEWGVAIADAYSSTPVGRALREYYGIHRRDSYGMSCADFAASNAEHMGPFLGKFARDVALSSWDLYAVEDSCGDAATLRPLQAGASFDVHATLHDEVFQAKTFVIARIVRIQNLTIATSVAACAAESTIALLAELRRRLTGRSRHAFMRKEGARVLLDGMLVSLQADLGSIRHRFRECSPRDVIALHALHSGVETAIDRGSLTSRVTAIGDVIGWVESRDDVRFIVQRGEHVWEFRRIDACELDDRDLGWFESMGLRPRLHGAVVCDGDVPEWCISVAEIMITRLT